MSPSQLFFFLEGTPQLDKCGILNQLPSWLPHDHWAGNADRSGCVPGCYMIVTDQHRKSYIFYNFRAFRKSLLYDGWMEWRLGLHSERRWHTFTININCWRGINVAKFGFVNLISLLFVHTVAYKLILELTFQRNTLRLSPWRHGCIFKLISHSPNRSWNHLKKLLENF